MAIEPLSRFRVTWRRIGDLDSFCHEVAAPGAEQARRASVAEIRDIFGPNAPLWEPDSVTPLDPPRTTGWIASLRALLARVKPLSRGAHVPAPEHEHCPSKGDAAP